MEKGVRGIKTQGVRVLHGVRTKAAGPAESQLHISNQRTRPNSQADAEMVPSAAIQIPPPPSSATPRRINCCLSVTLEGPPAAMDRAATIETGVHWAGCPGGFGNSRGSARGLVLHQRRPLLGAFVFSVSTASRPPPQHLICTKSLARVMRTVQRLCCRAFLPHCCSFHGSLYKA